jgi:aromatase
MRSTIGLRMAAPPEAVFALARDIERWPERLPHYRRVTVRGRREDRILAQMVAVRRFGPLDVPVTWRAICWSEADDPADLRLRFRHVRGVTRGMDVTWHIRPDGEGGSDVTIEHVFRRPLPLLGPDVVPAVVDRWFTTAIAGRTLRRFRQLAEAGGRPTGRSRMPSAGRRPGR